MLYDFRHTTYLVDESNFALPLNINEGKVIRFESGEQAYNWVMWLRNHTNAPAQDIIDEVNYQAEHQTLLNDLNDFDTTHKPFDVNLLIDVIKALHKGIYDIKFKCAHCGKIENYGESTEIEEKTLANTQSRLISKGITGGSRAYEVTRTYNIAKLRVCPICAEKHRIQKKKNKIYKALLIVGCILAFGIYILIDYLG